MAEWSKALDSKSGIRRKRIEGSNPSLSANACARHDSMRNGRGMRRRHIWAAAGGVLVAAGLAFPARADFELTAPDGRRVLLYDNGTWRYGDATATGQAEGQVKQDGEAVLTLERKIERGNSCRFVLRLVNNLPYEIRSLVPYYSAYRADGVIYDTVSSASSFAAMKPGDTLRPGSRLCGHRLSRYRPRTGRRRRPMRYGRAGQILRGATDSASRGCGSSQAISCVSTNNRRPRARKSRRSASPAG